MKISSDRRLTDYEKDPAYYKPVSIREIAEKTRFMTHALGRSYGSVELVWKHDGNIVGLRWGSAAGPLQSLMSRN